MKSFVKVQANQVKWVTFIYYIYFLVTFIGLFKELWAIKGEQFTLPTMSDLIKFSLSKCSAILSLIILCLRKNICYFQKTKISLSLGL